MSKVITPHFEQLIDRFIASGRFNNKTLRWFVLVCGCWKNMRPKLRV